MDADSTGNEEGFLRGIEQVATFWRSSDYREAVHLMRSIRKEDWGTYLKWLRAYSLEAESPGQEAQRDPPLDRIAYLADYETQVEEAKDKSEREGNRVRWFYEWVTVKPEVALDIFWSELLPEYRDSEGLAPYLGYYVGSVIPRLVQQDTPDSVQLVQDASDLVYEQEDDDFDRGQLYYSLVRAYLDIRRFELAAALLKQSDLVPERHAFWFMIGWHSSNPDDVEAALSEMKKSLERDSSDAVWNVLRKADRFLRKAEGSLQKRLDDEVRDNGASGERTPGSASVTLLRLTDSEGQSVFAAVKHAITALSDYRTREDCMGNLVDAELHKQAGKHLERLQRLLTWDEEGSKYVEEKLPELQLRLLEMRLDQCSSLTAEALRAHGFSKPISREATNRSLRKELGNQAWKRISRHHGVVRFVESGEWAWQNVALLRTNTKSDEEEGEYWDFAFLCAQFFKAVEEFLCQTLVELCPGESMTLHARGQPIPIGSAEYFDKATAGAFMFFIERHPTDTMRSLRQADELTSKLRRWTDEIRNAYQHRDVLHTESDAKIIRGETLELLKYMALFMKQPPGSSGPN